MVVVRLLRFFGKIRLNNQTYIPIVLKSKAPDLWVHGSRSTRGEIIFLDNSLFSDGIVSNFRKVVTKKENCFSIILTDY
jgi:hypothetical protein